MTRDGIHSKYTVTRTDGSSASGGKHERCTYFVLDLEHDEFAIPALKAYAKSCRKTHPDLADDLTAIIDNAPVRCNCREAMCPHTSAFSPNGHSEMAASLMADNDGGAR